MTGIPNTVNIQQDTPNTVTVNQEDQNLVTVQTVVNNVTVTTGSIASGGSIGAVWRPGRRNWPGGGSTPPGGGPGPSATER